MFEVNRTQEEQERDLKVVSLNWRLFDNARYFLLNTAVKNIKKKYKKKNFVSAHFCNQKYERLSYSTHISLGHSSEFALSTKLDSGLYHNHQLKTNHSQ
jgi:hypothetical protein